MTAVLLGWPLLAVRVAAGEAWAFWWGRALWRRAFPDNSSGLADWGYGYLLAGFLRGGLLLLLAVFRIPWSLPALLAAEGAIAFAATFRAPARRHPEQPRTPARGVAERCLLALAAAAALAAAFQTLSEPLRAYDFLAIWGLKARTMFLEHGPTRALFTSPALVFSHREYPLGWPLRMAAGAVFAGAWDEQALALVPLANMLAGLFLVHGFVRRLTGSGAAAAFAAAFAATLAPLWTSAFSGIADAPLAVALFASIALLRDRIELRPRAILAAGAIVAIPAWTKTEGAVAVLFFLLVALARIRQDRGAATAALFALVPFFLWNVWIRIAGLRLHRDLAFRLPPDAAQRLGEVLHFFARHILLPGAWAIAAGILLLAPRLARRPFPLEAAFVLAWGAAAVLGFCLSRLPLSFHLPTALSRVLSEPLLLLAIPMAESLAPREAGIAAIAGSPPATG